MLKIFLEGLVVKAACSCVKLVKIGILWVCKEHIQKGKL